MVTISETIAVCTNYQFHISIIVRRKAFQYVSVTREKRCHGGTNYRFSDVKWLSAQTIFLKLFFVFLFDLSFFFFHLFMKLINTKGVDLFTYLLNK